MEERRLHKGGEKMARDARHVQVQRQGKERDCYICQVCGSRERLEGHHIVDYHFGGGADKNNIITLCHECHRKVHRGEIILWVF